jgi:hypothetical protein
MTGLEAAQNFKIDINKLDRSNLIDIRIEKVLYYLNKAALYLVKKKYRGVDPGPGRLEIDHPVLDDLKVLLTEYIPDSITQTSPETVVAFASDHLYMIESNVQTTKSGLYTIEWYEGRYVKPERLYKELKSPFNKSVANDPVISIVDGKLVVYNTDFTVNSVKIKYLRVPGTIISGDDIELPFEDEIVDTAVSMALENFQSERIKTQPAISVANISE